jgi:cytidyltransferase-like protein
MKLGFTVGIWDLFHEGHINLLKKCREQCDYLFVGIMNDYWVRVAKNRGGRTGVFNCLFKPEFYQIREKDGSNAE